MKIQKQIDASLFVWADLNLTDSCDMIKYLLSIQNFTAPSMDDKILEVVAVFGSAQLGISRVINLQHHRIAQVWGGFVEQSILTLYMLNCFG